MKESRICPSKLEQKRAINFQMVQSKSESMPKYTYLKTYGTLSLLHRMTGASFLRKASDLGARVSPELPLASLDLWIATVA